MKHVHDKKLAEKRGGWTSWLREIGMSTSQADRFVKIFKEYDSGKLPHVGNIGFRVLYEIATLPEPERTKPHTIPSTGEVKTVDEMTVRELREVKRALKEAQQAKELAENGHRCPIWESLHYTKLQRYPNVYFDNLTQALTKLREYLTKK